MDECARTHALTTYRYMDEHTHMHGTNTHNHLYDALAQLHTNGCAHTHTCTYTRMLGGAQPPHKHTHTICITHARTHTQISKYT